MFGCERIGNFEVRPMGDGKYSYHTTVPGHLGAGVLYGEKALEEFRAKYSLERTPDNDEVVFNNKNTGGATDKVEFPVDIIDKEVFNYQYNVRPSEFYRATKMKSDSGLDLKISNGFMGMFNRTVKGKCNDLDIDLKLGDNMLNHGRGTLKGKIGNHEINLKYKVKDNKTLVLEGKGLDSREVAMNKLLSVLIVSNAAFNAWRDGV